MRKKPQRPRDFNQRATFVVDAATGRTGLLEIRDKAKSPAAVTFGERWASKGGEARAKKLSPERGKGRKAIAGMASAARWNKHRAFLMQQLQLRKQELSLSIARTKAQVALGLL